MKYIKHLNRLNVIPEMFFFPVYIATNKFKNIKSSFSTKIIDTSIQCKYVEKSNISTFINKCDIILVFEIFIVNIFELMLKKTKK